jgi:hypothetical protein
MIKLSITIVVALSALAIIPQMLMTDAHAKGLPMPSVDHTRGQMTVMIVMPVLITGALLFAIAYMKRSQASIQ